MTGRLRALGAAAAAFATAAALAYAGVALWGVRRFARRPFERADVAVPATILVPLAGAELGLEENLRAFVAQDYPQHQIVFGVHGEHDPARLVAERVVAAFPHHRVDVAIEGACGVARTGNPKVANLISMMRLARHDVLVLADSDMRVDPSYLATVTAPLRDPAVGAVTCVYAGVAAGSLVSRLGAMFITEQFVPSALVEASFAPLRHGFGATIAIRRAVLDAVGGLAALAPHLADDHALGRLVAERGLTVVLSRYVVRNLVADADVAALWRHELRWHRTIRSVQPVGYALLFLTYPLVVASVWALLARQRVLPLTGVVLAAAGRIALQREAARALGVAPESPALIPLRDAFGIAVWLCGARGASVRWREERLQVGVGDLLR